jgi:tetratricopeptide (TPR) repeat protein
LRSPHFHGLKATALMKLKRYQEAIDEASKAIALSARFGGYYAVRGYCYKQLGKIELARLDLEKGSNSYPQDRTMHEAASKVEALSGNLETAMSEADDAERGTAIKSVKQSTLTNEISSYTSVINLTPSKPDPYYDRAMLFAASGNLKSATADLRTFLKLTDWKGKSSTYAASLLVLFLREDSRRADADSALATAKQKISKEDLVPFFVQLANLKVETEAKKYARIAKYQTRERLLKAIDFYQKNEMKLAEQEIAWLVSNGDRGIDEFILVSVYNKKVHDSIGGKTH